MNSGGCPPRRDAWMWLVVLCAAISVPRLAVAGLVEVLPRLKPSVVAVGTFQRARSPQFRFLGTGFAVGSGRLIATNAHVVSVSISDDQMESLVVVVPGAAQSAMRKVAKAAVDPNTDLAVLRLDGEPLPALPLAEQSFVAEGQSIAFMGFPIGSALGLTPVTHRGIVAAVTPIGIPQANSRQLNPALVRRLAGDTFRVYQLDATAYPGNSGSPVFDPDSGEVLGIVNMVFVKGTKENALSAPSGITYAIPVSHLRALLMDVR